MPNRKTLEEWPFAVGEAIEILYESKWWSAVVSDIGSKLTAVFDEDKTQISFTRIEVNLFVRKLTRKKSSKKVGKYKKRKKNVVRFF